MKRGYSGQILILFLTIMSVGLLLVTSLLRLQSASLRKTKRAGDQLRAQYLAQAGIDKGLDQLVRDSAYKGETIVFNNNPVVVSIAIDPETNQKSLAATSTVNDLTSSYRVLIDTNNRLQFGTFHQF